MNEEYFTKGLNDLLTYKTNVEIQCQNIFYGKKFLSEDFCQLFNCLTKFEISRNFILNKPLLSKIIFYSGVLLNRVLNINKATLGLYQYFLKFLLISCKIFNILKTSIYVKFAYVKGYQLILMNTLIFIYDKYLQRLFFKF